MADTGLDHPFEPLTEWWPSIEICRDQSAKQAVGLYLEVCSDIAGHFHPALGLIFVVEDMVDGLETLGQDCLEEVRQLRRWAVSHQGDNHLAVLCHTRSAYDVSGVVPSVPCPSMFVKILYAPYLAVVEQIEKSLCEIELLEDRHQRCLQRQHPAG